MSNDFAQLDPAPMASANTRWYYIGFLVSSLVVTLVYCWYVRPDLRFWDGMVTHGDPGRRTVALTFDDGPHPLWAPLLADTLERHGAHGTFMLVGMEAQRYPELTARLVRGGHQLANHSMTHPYPNLTAFNNTRIAKEVQDGNRVLERFTGQLIYDFRPPGGGINNGVLEEVKRQGMRIAWWSASAADAESPSPGGTYYRLQMSLRPGAVELMHERDNTVLTLEHFLTNDHRNFKYETFTEVTGR